MSLEYLLLCVAYPTFVLGDTTTHEADLFTHSEEFLDPHRPPTTTTTQAYVPTPIDQSYEDYVMNTTCLGAWKLNQFDDIWRATTHDWVPNPDFTTDINMLVNADVKKNQSYPVVDYAMIDDMKEMNAYCRCWRSKKFPLCDGRHLWWNNRTGDNVGPVFIKERHLLNDSKEFYNFMRKIRRRK
ncbi:hypothetical protein WDU94_011431 [Cyamophila willieti]